MLYSFAKGDLHANRGQANLVGDGDGFQAQVDVEMGCKKAKGLLFSTRFSVQVTMTFDMSVCNLLLNFGFNSFFIVLKL